MIRALAVAAAIAAATALAGCGQKGPLRLPDPPKPAATLASEAAPSSP